MRDMNKQNNFNLSSHGEKNMKKYLFLMKTAKRKYLVSYKSV